MPLARLAQDAEFQGKINQMALPLAPLVRLTTGQVHPAFPRLLVNFWLLTEEQLDDLAHFYHQRTPCEWTRYYPCPMGWRDGLTLEDKRRKLGKFIGLRGCETPIAVKSEEQIIAEARAARENNDDELWKRKIGWY